MNLLLVGSTDRVLEDALRSFGMTAPVFAGAELASLAQPSAKQPDVIVIDLRDQTHLPVALPLLKRQHPSTGVVIVASRLDPALLLEAMRSGVNEFVSEPLNVAELEAAIKRVIAQRPVTATPGQIFAFVGAKGGVGTTTVAVNVATALAKLSHEETLLVDLHLDSGDAAVFLGQEPRFSIVDALDNTHRLDEVFFRGLIAKTKSGVSLLASSERMIATPLDVRKVRTLLDFATLHFRYLVLDVPRSDAAMLDALEGVTRIVVVANQELATVRSASRMATSLRQRYGKDKLSVVLSRADRLAEIREEDIARAVGSPVGHSFPSDYRRALEALNKGRPLTLENHNELSGSLVKFAESLAGVQKTRAERVPSRFGLFGSRRPAAQESK